MSKKEYLYLVLYFFEGGNGSSQIYRKRKVNSLKEFDELREYIEIKNGLKNVAIINIMLIGKERL